MNDVPDIISYDGKEFILWSSGVWKVKRQIVHEGENQVERQGDVLAIFTPDGNLALTATVYAADMMAQAIEAAVMAYYFEKGTNGNENRT